MQPVRGHSQAQESEQIITCAQSNFRTAKNSGAHPPGVLLDYIALLHIFSRKPLSVCNSCMMQPHRSNS